MRISTFERGGGVCGRKDGAAKSAIKKCKKVQKIFKNHQEIWMVKIEEIDWRWIIIGEHEKCNVTYSFPSLRSF